MTAISYRSEIYRKIFHICLIALPISYLYLTRQQMLCFLIPAAILIVSADHYRHQYPKLNILFLKAFGNIMRVSEKENSLSGTSYMIISALITFGFFEKMIAINAFTILAISDTAAALIGRKIKSRPFFEKSLAGSSAFFVTALIILVTYGTMFDKDFVYYIFGFLGIVTATIIEARPSLLHTDDNLTIPLSFCITVFLFSLIWSYNI